ncbi:MAG: Exonuclease RNase T and DNA polymerase III [Candidatus Nomurabacteria bacterium GW2011_GWC2_41_8]|uniref:Exonuclease RNase T and DNA polymerase III n=1 Tax=Candidatus Nomurabacteria bacterium GW2011_GWC2_41_8 TaxID=1618755 RepID=A0A0G0XHR9_9BACT|nr:MAG: Exonuclease RNase T and DNA polymerase III [Candidatus Nomurabacteria bacterium GW2011_GWC2_41_8]
MRKHNFAFIDIETTGLDVINHEIIEIGCVLTTPELQVIEEFEMKIKPEHLENADQVSLKISHYDENLWTNASTLKKAIKTLSKKVQDAIMVGQNVAFDSGFLEHAFSKTGVKNSMHYHKLDTLAIAWAKFHQDTSFEHFSLREMCERFGIKNERSHTALSDARATFELYKKLMSI